MMSKEAIKVLWLFLVWCSLGLYLEIPGPTLIDIKLLFNSSFEDVSRSVSGRGAGGFTGAVIGGIFADRFSHALDLFVAVSETIAGFAIMAVPYSFSVHTLWFHYFTLGACGGVIGIAGVRTVITMWPDKTASTLQLLHVGYGMGALLVPLIVNPFLAIIDYSQNKAGNQDSDKLVVIEGTSVQYAFVGIGLTSLLLSIVFYRYHWERPSSQGYKPVVTDTSTVDTKNLTFGEMINPATYANGQFKYGCYILLVLAVYFFFMVGGEEVYGNFVRSFSVEVFAFTKTQASYLNMVFWLGLTIGRLFWAVVSGYSSVKRIFAIQVILHTIATTLLNLYAASNPVMLWLCTAAEGFLVSPLYPGGIAYGNTLIEITGIILMVMNFAASCGDLSFIWMAGKLYDSFGPRSVLYALQLVGIVLIVCLVLLRIGERYTKHRPKLIGNST
ncbi:hypothetical protein ACF0H5_008507 [Mactra antiquata]